MLNCFNWLISGARIYFISCEHLGVGWNFLTPTWPAHCMDWREGARPFHCRCLALLFQANFWTSQSPYLTPLHYLWSELIKHFIRFSNSSSFNWTKSSLGSKGSIEVGKDADFVVWDPNESFVVTKDLLHFKNKSSPYEGQLSIISLMFIISTIEISLMLHLELCNPSHWTRTAPMITMLTTDPLS